MMSFTDLYAFDVGTNSDILTNITKELEEEKQEESRVFPNTIGENSIAVLNNQKAFERALNHSILDFSKKPNSFAGDIELDLILRQLHESCVIRVEQIKSIGVLITVFQKAVFLGKRSLPINIYKHQFASIDVEAKRKITNHDHIAAHKQRKVTEGETKTSKPKSNGKDQIIHNFIIKPDAKAAPLSDLKYQPQRHRYEHEKWWKVPKHSRPESQCDTRYDVKEVDVELLRLVLGKTFWAFPVYNETNYITSRSKDIRKLCLDMFAKTLADIFQRENVRGPCRLAALQSMCEKLPHANMCLPSATECQIRMKSLLCSYRDETLGVDCKTLDLWEQSDLKPINGSKTIQFLAICDSNDLVQSSSYLENLSAMYEYCNLGSHTPYVNLDMSMLQRHDDDIPSRDGYTFVYDDTLCSYKVALLCKNIINAIRAESINCDSMDIVLYIASQSRRIVSDIVHHIQYTDTTRSILQHWPKQCHIVHLPRCKYTKHSACRRTLRGDAFTVYSNVGSHNFFNQGTIRVSTKPSPFCVNIFETDTVISTPMKKSIHIFYMFVEVTKGSHLCLMSSCEELASSCQLSAKQISTGNSCFVWMMQEIASLLSRMSIDKKRNEANNVVTFCRFGEPTTEELMHWRNLEEDQYNADSISLYFLRDESLIIAEDCSEYSGSINVMPSQSSIAQRIIAQRKHIHFYESSSSESFPFSIFLFDHKLSTQFQSNENIARIKNLLSNRIVEEFLNLSSLTHFTKSFSNGYSVPNCEQLPLHIDNLLSVLPPSLSP